jgi:hypothetical protein
MNLLEIQDNLNKLLPRPESIQYLTAAAQGGNPQVPPYMALARINEINKQMQTAQQPQPPAEPLNQSLPKQAMQNMGIGALGQGQPVTTGSGAQLQTGSGGQVVTGGAPQMPPQQAPRQAPQQVMTAADGGLMSLPVDDSMFEYGSGGVVAFQSGGLNKSEETPTEQEVAEEAVVEDEPGYDAEAELKKILPYVSTLMKQQVRPVRSKQEIESKLTKDYGVDEGPIGKAYLEGLGSLKEAKAADRALQQADLDKRKSMAVAKALADWSESSRGQKGLGGLNAFTRSYTGSAEKLMDEEAGLRQSGIKVDELLNEAKYKLQALRQAQKDGDVKGEQKNDLELAKIAERMGTSKSNLISRLVTGNLNLMGKYETAQASRDTAATRAAAKNGAGKTPRETDQQRGVRAIAAGLKEKFPDMSDAEIEAMATNLYRQSAAAPAVAGRERKDINEDWRKEKYNPDYIEAKDKEAYERNWRAKWKQDNPDAAPVSAPAPTAGPISAEDFNAKWAKLKPGQKLVGPDGKTYTKG